VLANIYNSPLAKILQDFMPVVKFPINHWFQI